MTYAAASQPWPDFASGLHGLEWNEIESTCCALKDMVMPGLHSKKSTEVRDEGNYAGKRNSVGARSRHAIPSMPAAALGPEYWLTVSPVTAGLKQTLVSLPLESRCIRHT